jgi:hypothetical protein
MHNTASNEMANTEPTVAQIAAKLGDDNYLITLGSDRNSQIWASYCIAQYYPPPPMPTQTISTEKKLHVWYEIVRAGQAMQHSYFIVGPNDDEQQLRDAALKEWAKIGNPPIWQAKIVTTTIEEIKL